MAKNYKWSAAVTVTSGGYVGELITIEQNGVTLYSGAVDNPPQTFTAGWTTTSAATGSGTYTYTYLDSDTQNNNVASKVNLTFTESWSVSFDNRNYMTVAVSTNLDSATRTLIGSPSNLNRHLWLRRTAGGSDFSPFPLVDNASTAHTIASNVNMGNYSFTLAPGEDATRATVYWRNTTTGHESDPLPNIYSDILGIGIHFKNILPKDYRPGASLDTNTSVWRSHNRTNGACHVLSNTSNITWQECRTVDGDSGGQGNPPLMLRAANANSWYNQRLIGNQD